MDKQAEEGNRKIRYATLKAYQSDDLKSVNDHGLAFVTACRFARSLDAVRWGNAPKGHLLGLD